MFGVYGGGNFGGGGVVGMVCNLFWKFFNGFICKMRMVLFDMFEGVMSFLFIFSSGMLWDWE